MATSLNVLSKFGVGRRHPSDPFFSEGDALLRADRREGVVQIDEEDLCHEIVKRFPCSVFGCTLEFESLLQFELHYNSSHRYRCSECKKQFPSPHLLDLHISETHDSFFKAQAEKKPMYRCYIEHCNSVFSAPEHRRSHCIDDHKFPSNYKFDHVKKHKNKNKNRGGASCRAAMEVESQPGDEVDRPRFTLKPPVLDGDAHKVKFFGFSRGRNRFHKTAGRGKINSSDSSRAFQTSELMEALDMPDNTSGEISQADKNRCGNVDADMLDSSEIS